MNESLEVTPSRHLDFGQLYLAARINISEWRNNKQSMQYISFIKGKGGKKTSDYFRDLIGCQEGIDSPGETRTLLKAFSDFVESEGMAEQQAREKTETLVDYATSQARIGVEEHGILADAYRFQLGTRYPEREYCVQYDESDLHFVQRLCAEEGIHFHFRHSAEAHLLVFGDDQTVFPRLGRPTAYVHDSGLVADEPVIKRFSLRLASRTTRTTRRDYDFEKPRLLLEAVTEVAS